MRLLGHLNPRHLWKRFAAMLAMLLALVSADYAVLTQALGGADVDAARVRVSSQQTLLSERILQLTELAMSSRRSGTAPDVPLRETVDRFEQAHYALILGGRFGLDGELSASQKQILFGDGALGGLDRSVHSFVADARLLLDGTRAEAEKALRHMRIIGTSTLPKRLALLSADFEARAIARTRRAEAISHTVHVISIVVILLSGLLICRPAHFSIVSTLDKLEAANKQIAMKRAEARAHLARTMEAKRQVEHARREAEQAVRIKSEFVATMSHEIRTPMNGVLGMAELLAETELDDRQTLFVNTIQDAGEALLLIINDILDFSKLEAGRLDLACGAFDLRETIEDVIVLHGGQHGRADLALAVDYDPELPTCLMGDQGRIRQILTNLVGNAAKFTERGHVLVRVSGLERHGFAELTIEVEDTGIGIPAEKLALVFDAFRQVDGSFTREREGTGLGLAIVRRLVSTMGGEVDVASEPGHGSTFSVRLKLAVAEEPGWWQLDHSEIGGERILLIGRNPATRAAIARLLRAWRLVVDEVDTLDQIAQLTETPHMAIVDLAQCATGPAETADALRSTLPDAQIGALLPLAAPMAARAEADAAFDARADTPLGMALLFDLVRNLRWGCERIIPLSDGSADDPSDEPLPALPPDALRVLVADDKRANRLVAERMLNTLGARVATAADGAVAVDTCLLSGAVSRPELVLMDMSMPRIDGIEATRRIRAAERAEGRPPVPIVALTANASAEDRARCLDAGMDGFIAKPLRKADLARALEMAQTRRNGSEDVPIVQADTA